MGCCCGSGRWSQYLAPKVGQLYCIDPSIDALEVARTNLHSHFNVSFHLASVDNPPLLLYSQDFGVSLESYIMFLILNQLLTPALAC